MTMHELVFTLGVLVAIGSVCAGAVTDTSRYDKPHELFYYTAILGIGVMLLTVAFGLKT